MFKSLCISALAAVFMVQTARAGGSCCCDGSAPAAVAQAGATVAQAPRSSANRSYSYQPSVGDNDRPTVRSFRWNPGFRAADSKVRGNY